MPTDATYENAAPAADSPSLFMPIYSTYADAAMADSLLMPTNAAYTEAVIANSSSFMPTSATYSDTVITDSLITPGPMNTTYAEAAIADSSSLIMPTNASYAGATTYASVPRASGSSVSHSFFEGGVSDKLKFVYWSSSILNLTPRVDNPIFNSIPQLYHSALHQNTTFRECSKSSQVATLGSGETHGSTTFAKLKKQFEASNFSYCVALHKAFYGAVHDLSKLIKIYIRSVVNAKSQLEVIGVKVNNDTLKDIVLMNLDESFSDVRTSHLTQPTEPSFNTIHSVLGSSMHMVHPNIPAKLEDYVMAAKFKRSGGRKDRRSPGHGDSAGNWRDHSKGGGMKDEKGYHWCDTTNDHHCHRCGHMGHNTAHCMAGMPLEIKAWVLGSPGKEEHTMALRIIGVDEDFEDSDIDGIVFEKCL
ncbi:hypothetical protein PILCRDRAFT_16787 [Piloderma croceum F 1598]|uniref:CCHC-type domain-containing protein n=1 Tax=Piloderma croceum (strain F 1598) TaxID=765440 RepID=A0A0C3EV87_PILCF|nr:hypothetical protein PILCRDRAFT_16787 [Piloderma croceum F 1598]